MALEFRHSRSSINSLNQTGPIGKLVSVKLLPEDWPVLASGEVKLLIDDPTTKIRDGYAVDFARILVNPHKFKYEVSLAVTVVDADKHTPISGASVTAGLQSASTDTRGKCQLSGLPAGLVTAIGAAPGYDENSVPVDLIWAQWLSNDLACAIPRKRPFGKGLPHPALSAASCFKHGAVARRPGQQLAAQEKGILAAGAGQLVEEGLDRVGVEGAAHRAPRGHPHPAGGRWSARRGRWGWRRPCWRRPRRWSD